MKKNLTISLTVGIILSAAALYLAFRNVPILDLYNYLKSINYLWVIPSTLALLFSFVMRVVRWQPARRVQTIKYVIGNVKCEIQALSVMFNPATH